VLLLSLLRLELHVAHELLLHELVLELLELLHFEELLFSQVDLLLLNFENELLNDLFLNHRALLPALLRLLIVHHLLLQLNHWSRISSRRLGSRSRAGELRGLLGLLVGFSDLSVDLALQDGHLLLESVALLHHLLAGLLQLTELLDLVDQLLVHLLDVLGLHLLILLMSLDNLLKLHDLLLQLLNEPRVNLGFSDLSLKESSEPLGLLDVESQLSFVLLDLSELQGLLQVDELLFFLEAEVVHFLHFQLQLGNLAVLEGCSRPLHGLRHLVHRQRPLHLGKRT